MIITRSPLRISLGGGGTDLPSYYRDHGGFVVSAAIDKYVFITLLETFREEYLIKYSQTEVVQTVSEIKHPIIREALRLAAIDARNLEITSMADIPAGTGLEYYSGVKIAGEDPVYGKYIVIDHGGGLESIYGHASRLLVGQGTRVKRLQMIALSGSTGQSTAPHLHFEVRKNGEAVDPYQYVKQP